MTNQVWSHRNGMTWREGSDGAIRLRLASGSRIWGCIVATIRMTAMQKGKKDEVTWMKQ